MGFPYTKTVTKIISPTPTYPRYTLINLLERLLSRETYTNILCEVLFLHLWLVVRNEIPWNYFVGWFRLKVSCHSTRRHYFFRHRGHTTTGSYHPLPKSSLFISMLFSKRLVLWEVVNKCIKLYIIFKPINFTDRFYQFLRINIFGGEPVSLSFMYDSTLWNC